MLQVTGMPDRLARVAGVMLDWGKWLVLDILHIYNLPYQGGSHLVLCQFSYPLPHWINFLSHSFPV